MKHMSISKWLRQLGLPQYCTIFDEEYDGVEVKSAHTVSLDTHAHAYMHAALHSAHCTMQLFKHSHLKLHDCLWACLYYNHKQLIELSVNVSFEKQQTLQKSEI